MSVDHPDYWQAVTAITAELTNDSHNVDERLNKVYDVLRRYESILSEEIYAELFHESKRQISQFITYERDTG